MRKFQREIKQFDDIISVIERCATVRMAMKDEEYPYIVPLSFGYEVEGGRLTVFFHCATEGRKIDLLNADNRVCLEWDIMHGYVETGHSITADYESVIAEGKAEKCQGEEKIRGIKALLSHTGFENYSAEECAALPTVAVYKVVCESISGKKRFD